MGKYGRSEMLQHSFVSYLDASFAVTIGLSMVSLWGYEIYCLWSYEGGINNFEPDFCFSNFISILNTSLFESYLSILLLIQFFHPIGSFLLFLIK